MANANNARVDALATRLKAMVGPNTLKTLEAFGNSEEERTTQLMRLILGKRAQEEEALNLAEQRVSEWIAKEQAERRLDRMVEEQLRDNEAKLYDSIRLEIAKRQVGPDDAASLEKLGKLLKLKKTRLSAGLDSARPNKVEQIIGQQQGVKALMAALTTPYPQHILIYGPPGIGKTSAARLALEAARQAKYSCFAREAPFVEVDALALRFDPREGTNPLLGSVHDPIYQGANADLAASAVPEPKLGLVSQAHGGVLFIDEIGEMDENMQGKLLKVLEDKKVSFQSSYYDASAPMPEYVRELFENGAPADFVLIGATTRSPEEISPALRSRCVEIFFSQLSIAKLTQVTLGAAQRMGIEITKSAAKSIAALCEEGRSCVKLLSLSYGCALSAGKDKVSLAQVREAAEGLGLMHAPLAKSESRVGTLWALGVAGYKGCAFRVEAIAQGGSGQLQLNRSCGVRAHDAVNTAFIAVCRLWGIDKSKVNVIVNIQGEASVDGSSLGLAAALCILSALTDRPLRQDIAVTGEVSLAGEVLKVGGMHEKSAAAQRLGFTLLSPQEGIATIKDAAQYAFH